MEEQVLDVENEVESSTTEPEITAEPEITPVAAPQEMSDGEKGRARYLSKEIKNKTILLEEKQKRIDELEAAQSEKAIGDIPIPQEEDFDTTADFQKAQTAHTVAIIRKENLEIQASHRADQEAQNRSAAIDPFFKAAKNLGPEFEERVLRAEAELVDESGASKVDNQTQRFMLQNIDVGPQLLTHLHDHPNVLAELNGMDEFSRPVKLNELRQNLIKAGSARTKSGAPEPASTVDSVSTGAPGSFSSMTPEEMNKLSTGQLADAMRKDGLL